MHRLPEIEAALLKGSTKLLALWLTRGRSSRDAGKLASNQCVGLLPLSGVGIKRKSYPFIRLSFFHFSSPLALAAAPRLIWELHRVQEMFPRVLTCASVSARMPVVCWHFAVASSHSVSA